MPKTPETPQNEPSQMSQLDPQELERIRKENEQYQQTLEALKNDPQFQTYLQARKAGQELTIKSGNEPQNEPKTPKNLKDSLKESREEVASDDIDQMTNRQLFDTIVDSVGGAIEEFVGTVKEAAVGEIQRELEPLREGLTKTQKAVLAQMHYTSTENMNTKYPDYHVYQKEVEDVVQRHGLNFEDAYRLVKGRHVQDEEDPSITASEKPSGQGQGSRRRSTPRAPSGSLEPDDETREGRSARAQSGRGGFRAILQQKLDQRMKGN